LCRILKRTRSEEDVRIILGHLTGNARNDK
jgi:hypothetical protein